MAKRLFIDLDKCDACDTCSVECAYFYRSSMVDHGILTLREMATFALICRRCEEPGCVSACRFEALERQVNGVLRRHNMRCVSCKCCSQACPFGTIYPETVPFYVTKCDFCVASGMETPPCAPTCVKNAIEYREVEANEEEGVYVLNDHLAVHAPRWERETV